MRTKKKFKRIIKWNDKVTNRSFIIMSFSIGLLIGLLFSEANESVMAAVFFIPLLTAFTLDYFMNRKIHWEEIR